MKRVIFSTALLGALFNFASAADIKIDCSVKNGDKISGTVEIRATVSATNTVNQVEFYVGGELRSTDTSTPYTYTIDTIPEKEGPIKIQIAAYTSSGDSKKLDLTLTVDNGVDKGAKFHVDNANKFLNVSKWDEALQAARIALKADPNSADAKIAMARAYLGKDQLDKAQQWAEDALISQESVATTELLAGINAERAFRIISASGEKGDALKEITTAFKAAIAQREKTVELRIKAAGAVSDANRIKVADLMMEKHDYSAARRILSEQWNEGSPDLAVGNHLIYAAMRSGRMGEAKRLLDLMKKKSVQDATTFALSAAVDAYYRDFDNAATAIKDGGFDDSEAPSLMSASVYLALMQGDKAAAGSQINRMLGKDINSATVYYFLKTLMFYTGQYSESRDYFQKAILADPLLIDAYIERGYEALVVAANPQSGLDKDKALLLDQALSFFDLAYTIKPDSAEALNGLALTSLYMKKNDDAMKWAQGAVGAGPEFPWTHFTLAAVLNAKGDYRGAVKEVDKGGELDKVVLQGRGVPSADEAWLYTYRYARVPVIMLTK